MTLSRALARFLLVSLSARDRTRICGLFSQPGVAAG
jgi:hypothetical protein